METQADNASWRQHYPTYHFKERDIALEEYRCATKSLEAEERVFLNAANISIIIGAGLGSLALGTLDKLTTSFAPVLPKVATLTLVIVLTAGFSILLLRYFADRQKSVVFAARKVIVLRRMLGISYGLIQLVLPNWRIEGADEPFAIRLFPGWNTYVIYPCYAIAGISSAVTFFVLSVLFGEIRLIDSTLHLALLPLLIGVAALWFVILCWIYRKALLDTHERTSLVLAKRLSEALGLRLVSNIEYVIYRATLAAYELNRLSINLTTVMKTLVFIEDKEFYTHPGISLKGMVRLALYMIGRGRRSGGSTITQQLVRTLFIEDQSKLVRRKLVEIILALWFNKVFRKSDQLEMYIASVRFETGVYGLPAAIKYFFGEAVNFPSQAQAFFLVERVSNVRSRLLVEKVDLTLRAMVNAGLLSREDAIQVVSIYDDAINKGLIYDPESSAIQHLKSLWK